jgi:hypothetical protein
MIIGPALKAIGLWSRAAEQLVLGTAIQESGLVYLKQQGAGPALGFFQMEPQTHDDIWQNFLAYHSDLSQKVMRLGVPYIGIDRVSEMIGNAYYAAAMCRVLYYRVPAILPPPGDVAAQASYYKQHYNTAGGAATVDQYIANWRAAFPGGYA